MFRRFEGLGLQGLGALGLEANGLGLGCCKVSDLRAPYLNGQTFRGNVGALTIKMGFEVYFCISVCSPRP